MINVLLVDDHASLLRSLRVLLETSGDIQVIATASNGLEAVDCAAEQCPEVVVMDIAMPHMDGIEATRLIRSHCGYTRVVMLSIYDNPEYVQRSLDVGALGFVIKDSIITDLLPAIRTVYAGGRFFSQQVTPIARQYLDQRNSDN